MTSRPMKHSAQATQATNGRLLPRGTAARLQGARPRCLAALLCVLSVVVVGCGGPVPFATTFEDNQPDDIAQVMRRLEGVTRSAMRPVAVGASADNQQVFAYDLSAEKLLWTKAAVAKSPPKIAGDYVAVHTDGTLRILRLADGSLVDERSDEHMALMGADGDGALGVVVMSSGGSMGARSKLLILRDGLVASVLDVDYALGAPAVLGDLIFVPWNNVHVSVLQSDGQEIARLRVRGDVVSRAFAEGDSVYFGQLALFKFGEALAAGDKPGSHYFKPARERLPGNPAFMPAANKPPPPVQSALHSVKLSFDPAVQQGQLGLARDHLYLLFYRHLFALDPSNPSADWVYEHPEDVVGLRSVSAGVLLADEAGAITLVDHQGRPRLSQDMGLKPAVVTFRAESFSPSLGEAPETAPLADQLAAAAINVDARLVPSRIMAVEMLGALGEGTATSHLIALCEDAGGAPRVRTAACLTLSKQDAGQQAVLAALEQHANFLTKTGPPPVGALAEAAMNMKAKAALPHLLAHLRDPATAATELPQLMLAIKQLGDESVTEPVHDFLMLYHADNAEAPMLTALELSMDVLAQYLGAEAEGPLELIANDALGLPPLRAHAARVLATLPQPPTEEGEGEAEADTEAPSDAGGQAEEQPAEPEPPAEARPEHLTTRHVEHALKPVMDDLRHCLRSHPKHPRSARLTIVLDGEGDVLLVRTLPETLQECVEPHILSVPFPANKHARRQQVTYRLNR